MYEQPLILIIDDEKSILETLKDTLVDEQFRVKTLNDSSLAIDVIGELIPNLILLDIAMPKIDGIALLEKIKTEFPEQKVIMISGFGTISLALEAVKKGAIDFIEKPLNLDEILEKIAFLKDSGNKKNSSSKASLLDTVTKAPHLIGQSYLFKELIGYTTKVALLDVPIIIYGQQGTGKTELAQHIHNIALPKNTSFKTINCALKQPESSIEQAFELPSSTLYFKHIDFMTPIIQEKLLYLIQHNKNHNRIIASATQALFPLVQQKTFNAILFFHLNKAPIETPPLNKRRCDIPLLVHHFVSQENILKNKTVLFSTASIRCLRNFDWRGNISEIKQLVKNIVMSAPATHYVVTPDDLYEYLDEKRLPFVEEQGFTQFGSLQEAAAAFEKTYISHMLKKNRFDLEQASDRLHLKIPQLRAKMLELGIKIEN